MFHRVKSEGQDTQSSRMAAKTDVADEVNGDDMNELTQASDEDAEQDIQTTTQIEDSQDMNDSDAQAQSGGVDSQEDTAPNFSYQRPAQAAGRGAVGGYPGAASAPTPYAGASGYGVPARDSNAAVSSDRRLTIGSGITMSGEIESCDYLLVEGTVEAALKGANVLEIAESGTFYGTVEIGEANIAGRFEGDITVHGRLTISATGTVTGSIIYKELQLEAGALIDGKLTPLSAVNMAASAPKKAAAVKKNAPKAKKAVEKQEPANSDGGLFSKAAAE